MASAPEKKLSRADVFELASADLIKKIVLEQLKALDDILPANFTDDDLDKLEHLARVFKIIKEDLREDIKNDLMGALGLDGQEKPARDDDPVPADEDDEEP